MQCWKLFPSQLKTQWRRLSVTQRGTISITIPLLCLITSLSAHLVLRQRSIRTEQAVDHSQIVLLESHTLLVEMLNAETGVRGYYIRHRPEFLEPYESALASLPKTFDRLKDLVKDHPAQLRRIITLESLAHQKLKILQSGIQQVEDLKLGRPQNKLFNGSSSPGKVMMDKFRTTLAEMEAEEQQSLKIRQETMQQQRDLNILVMLLGVLISSVGSALAIGLFRDLARDLQKGELLLQESTNLIRAVFTNVVDGVLILDREDRIQGVNQVAQLMFGYPQLELLGQNWETLLSPDAAVNQELLLSRQQNSSLIGFWQAMGLRNDGNSFPIEVSLSEIELDDRGLVIIRDVTESQQAAAKLQSRAQQLVKLNTQLETTNAALSERNRELDQFAYVVSHDLKAPLRAIANLSTWIEEDLGQEISLETQQHMQLLRGRVHRMEALLNGLLDYAQIGRIKIPIESVNVAKLLATVVKIIAPPATFRVEIAANMPTFSTRRLLLQQVFINLIENAVDYHPTQVGTAQVSVQDQGDRYEFAVADDGAGIAPRFHDKIYVIFQTLEARDTRERRGVGLALVKKIVETEGGRIRLESAVGKGATFRFTWLKCPLNSSNLPITSMPPVRSMSIDRTGSS